MPERPELPEMISVPLGGYRALGWFFESSKDGFLAIEGEAVRRANPAWTTLTGYDAAATEGTSIWRFVAPEDLARIEPEVRALAQATQVEREIRLATRSGGRLWTRTTFVAGAQGWMLAIVRDITFEHRLRESEARFRGLVNATSDVVYRMSPDWREMRQLDGQGFLADTQAPSVAWADEYLLPEDQPQIQAEIDAAIAGGEVFQLEHRVRRSDGAVGWTFSRAVPIRDEAGEVVEWFGAATDVTERRRAEERLRLVVDELNHRVKNNLAMVEAAAARAFRQGGDLKAAEASLMARVSALAHASDLLTGDARVARGLRAVIEQAIRPHRPDAGRCQINGPEFELAPRKAHALSLALHELATNAVKHGAWSRDGGEVGVAWTAARTAGGRRLRLEWRESGGPPTPPHPKAGFGTRLIRRGLVAEFGGEVELRFEPDGLVCIVDAILKA